MNERCVCPSCGRGHKKRVNVDRVARARMGARARWGSGVMEEPQVQEGQALLTEAVHEKVREILGTKRPRPTEVCEHGKEYRFCRMATCQAALEG